MITDSILSAIFNKKIMPVSGFREKFQLALAKMIKEQTAASTQSDGAIGAAIAITPGGIANSIKVSDGVNFKAFDGVGNVLKVTTASDMYPYLQDVKIPPGAGATFHVGLEQPSQSLNGQDLGGVESGVEVNPRTGEYEYSSYKQMIGRLREPDSVVDNGGTLTLTVDSLGSASWDHSGRKVRVWLKSKLLGGPGPVSPAESVAIQELTVAYVSGHNVVTTVDLMGQTSPSTTASDYQVMLMGPTVTKATEEELKYEAGVVFLSAITSVALGNFIGYGEIDSSHQRLIAPLCPHGNPTIFVQADDQDDDWQSLIQSLHSDGTNIIDATKTFIEIGDKIRFYWKNGCLWLTYNVIQFTYTKGYLWTDDTVTSVATADPGPFILLQMDTHVRIDEGSSSLMHTAFRLWACTDASPSTSVAGEVASWITYDTDGANTARKAGGPVVLGWVKADGTIEGTDYHHRWNIDSVSKLGTGQYGITFTNQTNARINNKYCFSAHATVLNTNQPRFAVISGLTFGTYMLVYIFDDLGVAQDHDFTITVHTPF